MERLILKLIHFSQNFPKTIVFVFAMLTLFLGMQLPNLRNILSLHELIDKSLSKAQSLRDVKKEFLYGNSVAIAVRSKLGKLNATQVSGIKNWLDNETRANHQIDFASSAFSIRQLQQSEDRFWYFPLIEPGQKYDLAALSNTPWDGILTTPQMDDMVILLIFKDDPIAGKFGNFNPLHIENLLHGMDKNLISPNPSLEYSIIGTAPYSYACLQGIRFNSKLNIALLLLIIFFIWMLTRKLTSGIAYVVALAMSGIMLYGAMALFDSPMEILSSGLFMIICVASLEDFLFLMDHHKMTGQDFKASIEALAVPSFYTSLTTVLGFGSLCFSGVGILERFGFWAAIGAALEWFVLFIFLDAFSSVFKFKLWFKPSKKKSYAQVNILKYKLPKFMASALFGVYVLAALSLPTLEVGESPLDFFPKEHQLRNHFDYFSNTRGWQGQISVVFNENVNGAEVSSILEMVKGVPGVVKVEDPDNIIKFIAEKIPHDSSEIRSMVERDFRISKASKQYFSSKNRTRAIAYVSAIESKAIETTIQSIKYLCKNMCTPEGELVAYSEFASLVPDALFKGLGISFLLVAAVIFYLGRRLNFNNKAIAVAILCSLWGPAFMILVLKIFAIKINFLTSVFATVLVGLAGDNTIQFLYAAKDGEMDHGIRTRANASVQVALIMSLSSLIFVFSAFAPPRTLGILVGIGLMASLLGDIWILQALFPKQSRKKLS